MTASRLGASLAVGFSLLGCASRAPSRRPDLYPPAHESRAGAPARSVGPVLGPDEARASTDPAVERALASAVSLVGKRTIVLDGVDYGSGCAALVKAAFAAAGRPLPRGVDDGVAVHAYADRQGALSVSRRPTPGDVVFLADAPGGPPVHVGLVARADPDGTAVVLERMQRGVLRIRVNLSYPDQPTDPATGKQINDTVLVNSRSVTAGSLVVGFSDLLRRRS